jgi:hypothetical protein
MQIIDDSVTVRPQGRTRRGFQMTQCFILGTVVGAVMGVSVFMIVLNAFSFRLCLG